MHNIKILSGDKQDPFVFILKHGATSFPINTFKIEEGTLCDCDWCSRLREVLKVNERRI